MENDRHEERIQILERDSMSLQLANAKIEGRLRSIDDSVADMKKKLSVEIAESLRLLTHQVEEIIPQVTSIRQWGDIYKNAMLIGVGSILTALSGFVISKLINGH